MRILVRLALYQLREVVHSRWALVYTLLMIAVTDLLLRFSVTQRSALLAVGSAAILLVPLVTLLFAALYMYAARPFHELLLAQPISRLQLFAGAYTGTALPLSLAFAAGVFVPLVFHLPHDPGAGRAALIVAGVGVALTLVCTGIALLVAAAVRDRVKGVGVLIAIWLALAVLYDSAILLTAAVLTDYPLDRPLVLLMMLNPIDLARVVLLLEMDASAMMGYTGAVLSRMLGAGAGRGLGLAALACWILLPPVLGWRLFERRDF
jgi:Cu-processing system permease protein